MVYGITSYGQVQALQAIKRAEQAAKQREEKVAAAGGALDTVNISSEALDLAAAGQAAKSVKAALQGNGNLTLGLDPAFDERA
jgi:hypothetical protein